MANMQFLNWIEGQAHGLRGLCGLSTFARLEPLDLANRMLVTVIDPSKIPNLAKHALNQLTEDSTAWSAGTLHLPNGRSIVVMNAAHEKTRQRASLMEELVHIHLKHKPTQLISVNELTFRSWSQTQETQAYWIGSAALLTRRIMRGAKTLGWSQQRLAEAHGVSVQLVEFRQKVTGVRLFSEYEAFA